MAALVLDKAFVFKEDDLATWPGSERLAPHVSALARVTHGQVGVVTSGLLRREGLFHYSRGSFASAEPLMRRALEIDETFYGLDHPAVSGDLNNLASLLRATNRRSEAEPLMRRALELYEGPYGPDHPNVATLLNNLASLLETTNRLSEAEPLMRRALEIAEASLGPDHPDTLTFAQNLAALANVRGDNF